MKITTYIILFLVIYPNLIIAQQKSIHEEKFISIEGIQQWITIKGDNITKPIILFIHGGPGSTMSLYDDAMYGDWEKDFILVNWDQRGAGKTYGHNAPAELDEAFLMKNQLTVTQMTKDGIELTKYLLQYLKKKKVILLGTSWGSILGVKMALNAPELFYAYIGHSQFVSFSKNMEYSYNKVYDMSKEANDSLSIKELELMGTPPYDTAKNYGQLLRVVKKYERINSDAAPDTWFKISSSYDNEKDENDRSNGDDFSFINFVGHKKLGVKSMGLDIDFDKDALSFKIPVYLIQGEQDILTAKAINKPYFDKIKAPKKEYFLLPNAAHGHNQTVVDKQYDLVKALGILE